MTTRTAASSGSALIRRVAASPSVPGMRMSMRTTSARRSRASSTASAPSDASPTTSMSGSESTRTRKALRSRAWSSASRTRMVIRSPPVRGSRAVGGRGGAGLDGQDRMDAEAAAVAGTGGEGAAQGGDPFPHAEQAVPAAGSRRGALVGAVVEHGDLDVRPDADDADLRPGPGPGVFLHVGEGLLDDPVGGRVDGGGQGGVPDVAGHLHVQPGAAEGAREFVQAVQAGRGLGRCLGVPGLAEQADGGAQLVQGGAAGLADVGEGLLGLVGPLVHGVGGAAGLDVGRGDVAGADVVQGAGDAQAYLGDPAAGLLLAGAVGTLGAFPDGLDDGAAAADGVTGAGADAGPGEDREVLLRVPGQRAGGHGGAGQDGHGEQAEAPGGGPVGGGGDGVERD